VITQRCAARADFSYGLPRGVGLMASSAGNLGMGLILLVAPWMAVLVWTLVTGGLAGVAARLLAPANPAPEGHERLEAAQLWRGLKWLLGERVFRLAVAANGLIKASLGFCYSFSALTWRRQRRWMGGSTRSGRFAVAAEGLPMRFVKPWWRLVGPLALNVFGAIGAMNRWTALAFSPPLAPLFRL
jgi:PPP family 3-phenylpropionic acid transporter